MLQAVRGMEDRGTEQGNMTALTNHRTNPLIIAQNNYTKTLMKLTNSALSVVLLGFLL